MNENKNIDRLFQEKFKDFEVFPDSSVWKNIEKQITKKKKRRIVPLWFRLGGAAAILLLLISSGFWYFNNSKNKQEIPNEIIITDTEQSNDPTNNEESQDKIEKEVNPNPIKTNQEEKLIAQPTQKKYQTRSKKEKIVEQDKGNNITALVPEESSKNDKISTTNLEQLEQNEGTSIVTKTENLQNSENIIALEENSNIQKDVKNDILNEIEKTDSDKIEVGNNNKWSIGSTMAPVYFNSLSSGSPIDSELSNNDKSSIGTISYGLRVNYKISDKLSLQSGINSLELGYTTENVATLLSSALLDGSSTNIDTNVEGAFLAVMSTASQSSDASSQRSSFDVSGSLDQTLGYVEIPMELKYNILQKKLGVNVLGGFSTYFLYRNSVEITSFGKTTTLGEASNINSLNFSGNLGLDFDYKISKKLYINVTPMFKYQFNTFSENSGGFQPYYLGIYSGLNFRF